MKETLEGKEVLELFKVKGVLELVVCGEVVMEQWEVLERVES